MRENRSHCAPTCVFVKTTPGVWRITELHSCKPPRHRVKLLPNHRTRHFHLQAASESRDVSIKLLHVSLVELRSLCDTLLQLGYTTLGTCCTSCWESCVGCVRPVCLSALQGEVWRLLGCSYTAELGPNSAALQNLNIKAPLSHILPLFDLALHLARLRFQQNFDELNRANF